MIFGCILAGGTGTRMNTADMPKQFLVIGHKPVVIHTVEKYLSCQRLHSVYVGVHCDWVEYMQQLVEEYLPQDAHRVVVTVGGSDRNETIQSVIRAIERDHGQSDEHIIVTHDAVRPFLELRMLEENIDACLKWGAVNTVLPAVDTIVVSDDGQTITEIPDRTRMYQGQSPQTFRINLIKELYATLTEDEKKILTDACKICVIRDHPVYLVKGSGLNMKITTPGDYEIARAIAANLDM